MRHFVRTSGFALALAGGFAASASAAAISYTDFATFQAAAPALTTETFETAPWTPADTKAQGTSNLGVTWTSENILSTFDANGGTVVTSLDPASGDFFDTLYAVMPDDVTAVGGWITSFNMAHDTTLYAFDSLDNLIGSVSLGNTGEDYLFFGLTTDEEIARIMISSSNVTNAIGDDFALDDFVFGGARVVNPVPEPATLALFGVALGALAWRRRKARA